jgi:hypothetical protein
MPKNENYTHFAVNKKTGLIVNGWDYSGYDSDDLRRYKKDYFINDLIDYEFDPKDYVILTRSTCIRRGINPDDMENCWSNRGELPLNKEKSTKINESKIRGMVEEAVKRILFENESYGWEVDESEANSAYEYLCNEIGEQEANAAIVRSIGSEALAASLAYIFRMYDMRGWKEYKDGEMQ